MHESTKAPVITDELILNNIYFIRGQKVMLDFDLSNLYALETKMLKRAVKRNLKRFPFDFMFELTQEESLSLRHQIGTLKRGQGLGLEGRMRRIDLY